MLMPVDLDISTGSLPGGERMLLQQLRNVWLP